MESVRSARPAVSLRFAAGSRAADVVGQQRLDGRERPHGGRHRRGRAPRDDGRARAGAFEFVPSIVLRGGLRLLTGVAASTARRAPDRFGSNDDAISRASLRTASRSTYGANSIEYSALNQSGRDGRALPSAIRTESSADRASVAARRTANAETFASAPSSISRTEMPSRWRDRRRCSEPRQRSTASTVSGAEMTSQTGNLRVRYSVKRWSRTLSSIAPVTRIATGTGTGPPGSNAGPDRLSSTAIRGSGVPLGCAATLRTSDTISSSAEAATRLIAPLAPA